MTYDYYSDFTGDVDLDLQDLFDKIEEVAVPVVHFDDAPAASKGLGEAGYLGH